MIPEDASTTSGYNIVAFRWEAVEGAQKYFLEIDESNSFNFKPQRYLLDGTYKEVVDEFDPNETYYWRVRPFAEYVNCNTPFSEVRSFITGNSVSVGEIAAVNAWTVQPNPVQTDATLNINIDASKSFEAHINLYDVAGKLVKTISNRDFNIGLTSLEMSVDGLNPGLYLVAIHSDAGVMNQKVIITE